MIKISGNFLVGFTAEVDNGQTFWFSQRYELLDWLRRQGAGRKTEKRSRGLRIDPAMKYTLTSPCADCPFLKSNSHGYPARRLEQFTQGEFPCHKTAEEEDENRDFRATADSLHCAGALIYLERRGQSHQMMRIAERLGFYDRTKLKMDAKVR